MVLTTCPLLGLDLRLHSLTPPHTMNGSTLVGRAGRDPEVRYFESGTNVCNLTLAVNRRKRDEDPDWFNLEIWGKTAQVAGDYVRKGGLIGVTGSMHQDEWTDRTTGEKKIKWVVRVDKLDLLGSKRDSEGDGQPRQAAPAQPAAPQPTWGGGPVSDEEAPF